MTIADQMGYRHNATVAHLMAESRQQRSPRFQATLGLINANEDRDAFTRHPTIPFYVQGCRRRAQQLGYALDEFWLHDPTVNIDRFLAILKARNIRGLVVTGLMQSNRFPSRFAPLWEALPAVVTGVATREPHLSFACTDHHGLALSAFEKVISLGYRRPALVLDGVIDDLIDGRFTAGFLTGQRKLVPEIERTQPFHDVAKARENPEIFRTWFEEAKPDIIFTLYHEVGRWLSKLGVNVPDEVGLVQYEWRADHALWAGMDQRNDLVGEAAMDMLISMIHRNESGIPQYPRATLIGSHWVDGETVRKSPPEMVGA